jgi:predicted HicB family RNase H-like nuclease
MGKLTYNGITFRENYDSTFEVFKAEFENTHVFKKFPEKERLVKLKEVFKVATSEISDIKAKDAKVVPKKIDYYNRIE